MKRTLILSILLACAFFPGGLRAISENETMDRLEMSQVWVDRHNAKLDPSLQSAIRGIRVKPHVYFIASRHRRLVAMRRLLPGLAPRFGIPLTALTANGAEVPLVFLGYSKAEGQSFLTADYADEWDIRHCSSEIYIKIGLEWRHLFHGQGYPGCARLVSLGKEMPVFFEVGTYGGGSRCDRTFYRLVTDALQGVPDELYNRPELVDVQKYVKEELELNVWLEGYTLYRDLNHDGTLEIINTTDVLYPPDLKTQAQERYQLTDNDFAGPFRRMTTVYQWDASKSQFVDKGDYYH